ncbi:MAG: endo-1,4-beta-xylanase [Deltaproteobacteria bacterium]|nr:endo-1,4-beta-xylanase [Deltaproteobacteria bacterium]
MSSPARQRALAVGLAGALALVAALGGASAAAEGPTLAAAAARTGRQIGVAVAHDPLVREIAYGRLIAREFSSITPENELKWSPMAPAPEVVDDSRWETVLAAAAAAGQQVRGHTLLWDQQLPSWAVALPDAALLAAQRAHTERLLAATSGRIAVWDVVNEALEDDGSLSRTAMWRAGGERHLTDTFRTARQMAPEAKLFYNDYGVEGINPKSDGMFAVLRRWRAAGVPVDGVGLQCHLKAGEAPPVAQLRANIQRLGGLGLDVHLTEIDVQVRHLDGSDWGRDAVQARLLHQWVEACVAEPACTALTFWGLSDRHTWVDHAHGDDRPLLFDDELEPKLSYFAVRAALLGKPDPTCAVERLPEGGFDKGMGGWRASGGQGAVVEGPSGGPALRVSGRTATWQGPVRTVTDSVADGLPLRARAQVTVGPGGPAKVALTAHVIDGAGERFVPLAAGQAQPGRWTALEGALSIDLKAPVRSVELYVEGPPAGQELWLDGASLRVDCPAAAGAKVRP